MGCIGCICIGFIGSMGRIGSMGCIGFIGSMTFLHTVKGAKRRVWMPWRIRTVGRMPVYLTALAIRHQRIGGR
jgi:hypothetical protein